MGNRPIRFDGIRFNEPEKRYGPRWRIATRNLAEVTWDRYRVLTTTGAVSRQEGDTQYTSAKAAEENVLAQEKTVHAAEELVRASQASLDRLLALQAYEQVTAPFDGAITARNVDVGSLISATGASQGPTPTNPAAPTSNPAEPSDVPAAASFLGWQRLPGFAFWFRSPK